MNAAELLAFLSEGGVELSVAGGRLHVDAPKGVLTPALLADLTRCKAEIIDVLRRFDSAKTISAVPLPSNTRHKHLPVSYAQQGEWYLNQLVPGSSISNFNVTRRARGKLDVAALERSFKEILKRHAALRTTFSVVQGRPVQTIVPNMSLAVPVVDLRQLPDGERESEALRLATEDARQPFDLTRGPFVRVTLLRLDDEEHLIVFTIHHIATDGWSLGVFGQELMVLYEAFSTGKASPLPELRAQYADFVAWQQRWLQGERLERQLAYWKKELAGAPRLLKLPTDRPRPPVLTFRGAHKSFDLSASLLASLKETSRREGVTLFMTLMSAFTTLLYLSSGQEDILVGNNIANRPRIEFEMVQGIFVNTLVLRTNFSGNPSLREVLHQVRDVALRAYEYQDLPFERLVKEVQPRLDPSHAPLVQVGFSMRNMLRANLELFDLSLSPVEIDTGAALTDLVLFVMNEGPKGLQGIIEYSTELFNADTIERFIERFKIVLTSMTTDLEQRVEALAQLSKSIERRDIPINLTHTGETVVPEQLLAKLDLLSDQQVDALLSEMFVGEVQDKEAFPV